MRLIWFATRGHTIVASGVQDLAETTCEEEQYQAIAALLDVEASTACVLVRMVRKDPHEKKEN